MDERGPAVLVDAAIQVMRLLRDGARDAGYAVHEPSVQVALLGLTHGLTQSIMFKALGDDVRYELRQWRRGER